jgi:hypothetical protein
MKYSLLSLSLMTFCLFAADKTPAGGSPEKTTLLSYKEGRYGWQREVTITKKVTDDCVTYFRKHKKSKLFGRTTNRFIRPSDDGITAIFCKKPNEGAINCYYNLNDPYKDKGKRSVLQVVKDQKTKEAYFEKLEALFQKIQKKSQNS